jgi:aspartyl aminopeptidase
MDQDNYIRQLLHFLKESPTAFHAVHSICRLLATRGFTELHENESWDLKEPGCYFIRRNGSSLILLSLAHGNFAGSGLRMAGAHTDSPALKIKPKPDMVNHGLLQLGVETYGGALLDPWFDRDLSIAGRVTWRNRDSSISSALIDFARPVAVIPSLAIHLNRDANEQKKINKQTDLVPIIMQHSGEGSPGFAAIVREQLAREHNIREAEILDHELFLYDSQPAATVGIGQEFITGARLDNLLSCFSLAMGLVDAEKPQNSLIVLNDHEEVGSLSTSGAQGPFLRSTLERLIPDSEARQRCIQRSLFISTDNAHGVHPNFADQHDKNHLPRLNMGPVIKYNANQRYATTSRTASFFRVLAEQADIPVQEFVMRSDLACGSTIGPITAGALGIQTLDIGVASLAMHSIREMAGAKDGWHLYRAMRTFFTAAHDHNMWQCLAG